MKGNYYVDLNFIFNSAWQGAKSRQHLHVSWQGVNTIGRGLDICVQQKALRVLRSQMDIFTVAASLVRWTYLQLQHPWSDGHIYSCSIPGQMDMFTVAASLVRWIYIVTVASSLVIAHCNNKTFWILICGMSEDAENKTVTDQYNTVRIRIVLFIIKTIYLCCRKFSSRHY